MPWILFLGLMLTMAFRSDLPAYRLYNSRGKPIRYDELLQQAAQADVVLFGELHNNPICHWLQLQLAKDLAIQKKEHLILGAEMVETDNQTALSDYVSGRITAEQFGQQARLWPNYATDYKPLVELARTHQLPFLATNVPRRFASLVARNGIAALDTLSADDKKLMPPLPIPIDLNRPGYRAMIDMMGDTKNAHTAPNLSAENMARAQALKDATMAYVIGQHLRPGYTLLHLNGDYHSKNFDGIVAYLRQQTPSLHILTISSLETPKPDRLRQDVPATDWQHRADVLLVIAEDMTKTY